MEEIKYRGITTYAKDGRALLLTYAILVDKSGGTERYGVKITEHRSGEYSQVLDLTNDTRQIFGLIDRLAKCAVTPTTLADVVADWLYGGAYEC